MFCFSLSSYWFLFKLAPMFKSFSSLNNLFPNSVYKCMEHLGISNEAKRLYQQIMSSSTSLMRGQLILIRSQIL